MYIYWNDLRIDLLYLQDLLKLSSDDTHMKVTVRQLRGRPGVNNWHPLLQQLQEIGISKFLVDVTTENLADFFQQVTVFPCSRSCKPSLILGQICWSSRSLLRFCSHLIGCLRGEMASNLVHISEYHRFTILRSTRSSCR